MKENAMRCLRVVNQAMALTSAKRLDPPDDVRMAHNWSHFRVESEASQFCLDFSRPIADVMSGFVRLDYSAALVQHANNWEV